MNKEKETHHIWTSGEDWWQRVLDDENTRLTRRCDVEHNWAMLSIETFYRDTLVLHLQSSLLLME